MWGQHHIRSTASLASILCLFNYTLYISEPIDNEVIFAMTNQCLVCLRQLNSKAALKSHTGSANPTLCKPHVCRRSDRTFYSQKAMEQHRDSPDHTIFSCDACNKSFGRKQAMRDHQKSLGHENTVRRAERARQARVSATTSVRNVRSYPMVKEKEGMFAFLHYLLASSFSIMPHTPAILSSFALYHTDNSSTTAEEYCSDSDAWTKSSHVEQNEDQDWALCDKDCWWCGYRADRVDY
jgi:hypothetical protein